CSGWRRLRVGHHVLEVVPGLAGSGDPCLDALHGCLVSRGGEASHVGEDADRGRGLSVSTARRRRPTAAGRGEQRYGCGGGEGARSCLPLPHRWTPRTWLMIGTIVGGR